MMENFEGFFGKGIEFWIGKVVRIDKQRSTASGMSWGFRYKVRIMGTYSNADNPVGEDVEILLAVDVWEHTYYLDYKQDRKKFLETFMENLINYAFIEQRLLEA